MEIAVNVQSVSYYHSSKTLYSTVEVFEKRILEENSLHINYFKVVEIQQKINLIYKGEDVLTVLNKLSDRVLKINISGVEQAKDPTKGVKFIIRKVTKCELLQV